MSQFGQNQAPVAYPPPVTAYTSGPYVAAQPAGYPMKDGLGYSQNAPLAGTKPWVAYPTPVTAYTSGPYVTAPPAGYPMKDGLGYSQSPPPATTKPWGDGFLKGCCAALRCCSCAFDAWDALDASF